jgi:hypothetical protein
LNGGKNVSLQKPRTVIEENLLEVVRAASHLYAQASEIYFAIPKGHSVTKPNIERLKKLRDNINKLMENW